MAGAAYPQLSFGRFTHMLLKRAALQRARAAALARSERRAIMLLHTPCLRDKALLFIVQCCRCGSGRAIVRDRWPRYGGGYAFHSAFAVEDGNWRGALFCHSGGGNETENARWAFAVSVLTWRRELPT
jgi:hypothetical protein